MKEEEKKKGRKKYCKPKVRRIPIDYRQLITTSSGCGCGCCSRAGVIYDV